ncbi:MAG: hypothetical protein KGL39_27780 [Patescibacteria group bacterium]|nr:hypothetical protein [Patescibacteria group bacterium]
MSYPQSGSSFSHVLRGQIGLPHGGGTRRLYLLSASIRSDWKIWQEEHHPKKLKPDGTPYMDTLYSASLTASGLSAMVSLDFGQSFETAQDVGIQLQDGTDLSPGRTSALFTRIDGVSGVTTTTGDLLPIAVPLTLIITPNGRIFVRCFAISLDPGYVPAQYAAAGRSYTFSPSIWSQFGGGATATSLLYGGGIKPWNETKAPKICDNVFLRPPIDTSTGEPSGPAFRDASTANQTATLGSNGYIAASYTVGSAGADYPAPTFIDMSPGTTAGVGYAVPQGPDATVAAPSMFFPLWQSCGAHPATKGAGARVKAPAKLYTYLYGTDGIGHYYSSVDGGDTWAAETGLGAYTADVITGNALGLTNSQHNVVGVYGALSEFARDHTRPTGLNWFDNGRYVSYSDVLINSPRVYIDETTSSYAIIPPSGHTCYWLDPVPNGLGELLYTQHHATQDGAPVTPPGFPDYRIGIVRAGQHLSADAYTDSGMYSFAYGTGGAGTGANAGKTGHWYGWQNATDPNMTFAEIEATWTPVLLDMPSELDGLYSASVCSSSGWLSGGSSASPPSQASDFMVAYTWGGTIVIVYGLGGKLNVYRSQDFGRTMAKQTSSSDNGATWSAQ